MTKYYEHEGERRSLREVAKLTGIGYHALWRRARRGQPLTEVPYKQGVADANRRRTQHGAAVDARGGKHDLLYQKWCAAKNRCANPNAQRYARYGGRGIAMHPEWVEDFDAFRRDVGYPPSPEHTLDRIDNNGDYAPGNVRWATRKEQANNRESNVRIEYEGATRTKAEWADFLQWPYHVLHGRWRAGDRGAKLFRPYRNHAVVQYDGRLQTLAKWAAETGVPYITLWRRYHNGEPLF